MKRPRPSPPDLATVVDQILEENLRRAVHLGSRDVLAVVDEIARIASLIDASRIARQHFDQASAEQLLDKARQVAVELLGITAPRSRQEAGQAIAFAQVVEVYWAFGDETDPDWTFCRDEATFVHRNASEFLFHIAGDDDPRDLSGLPECARETIRRMEAHGCSSALVYAYTLVAKAGGKRVLFWC